MLAEITGYLIIMIFLIFVGGVIGYLTLGKATRFYTRQVLEEIEERIYEIGSDGYEYLLFTRYYRMRGTLNYIRKYEKVRCQCYNSLQALIEDDKLISGNNKNKQGSTD